MDRKLIGDFGESETCAYLQNKGYVVLNQNYHSRYGEIDIIAEDGEYTVFVEVKTRKNRKFANPCEFVDNRKKEKIIKCATDYIQKNNIDTGIRFDVVEVLYGNIAGENIVSEINHIKNAFWLE